MQIPQPLTQGQGTLQQHEAHWYAVYVVARHEKVVAQKLIRRSVESFLPLYDAVRCWKKRRVEVKLPLFPSYLFVRIPAADRLRVLEIPSVVQVVSSYGVPVEVPKEDIETLRTVLKHRRSQPYPYPTVGTRVRIQAGALRGLEGVVLRQNSQTRIIVSVDFIQRSASVELRPEDMLCRGPRSWRHGPGSLGRNMTHVVEVESPCYPLKKYLYWRAI